MIRSCRDFEYRVIAKGRRICIRNLRRRIDLHVSFKVLMLGEVTTRKSRRGTGIALCLAVTFAY
ncbi:hypothetical protein NECAME_05141 [Necator americanus]|uniref:Uncharacterized protein n=1 Tax=Necator americanus TaxID=51031 RepID=W2SLE1_NECAM|nr:hypothetical protein NECAME_05141 [Necator americanus]ETN69686.1 hypothetical protein NECAME_05141 [Necator americanus]